MATSFTTEQITLGLTVMAGCNGNGRQAEIMLKEQFGVGIDYSTLYKWVRNGHADQYQAIRREVLPKLQARAAEQYMDASERMQAVSLEITESMNIADIPERDKPGAARNMTIAAATSSDKALLLTGQATEIHEHRKPEELLRALQAKLGNKPKVIEAESEVIAPIPAPKQD